MRHMWMPIGNIAICALPNRFLDPPLNPHGLPLVLLVLRECENEPRDSLTGSDKGWFSGVIPSFPTEHPQVVATSVTAQDAFTRHIATRSWTAVMRQKTTRGHGPSFQMSGVPQKNEKKAGDQYCGWTKSGTSLKP